MPNQVFLSYAREDRADASGLSRVLKSLGYEVWWDHQLLPSENFRAAIRAQLDKADCVIVLWTEASVNSQWVIDEAERAAQAGKLVPIAIGALEPEDIPIGLNRQHLIIMPDGSAAAEDTFKRQLVEAMAVSPNRRRGAAKKEPVAHPGMSILRAIALAIKAFVYSLLFVRTAMNMLTQDYNYYVLGFDGRLDPETADSRSWMLQNEDGIDVWVQTSITATAFIAARLLHGINFKGRASFSLSRAGASHLFTARALIAFVAYVALIVVPFSAWHYFHPDYSSKVPLWWAAEQLFIFLWAFPWLWLGFEIAVYFGRSVWGFFSKVKDRAI